MNLIFDLDGTLIDSRLRLYRLFQHLVPKSTLSFDEYWELKRRKISNQNILANKLGFESAAIERFVAIWMERIEDYDFLALDKSFPGIEETLESLGKKAKLHVCTARQARQPVLYQLKRLGLLRFFESIMVTEQTRAKEELIAATLKLAPQDWIIGDTGKDIQVGKVLGIQTCAVLNGFLNEENLLRYCPDLVLGSAVEFRL